MHAVNVALAVALWLLCLSPVTAVCSLSDAKALTTAQLDRSLLFFRPYERSLTGLALLVQRLVDTPGGIPFKSNRSVPIPTCDASPSRVVDIVFPNPTAPSQQNNTCLWELPSEQRLSAFIGAPKFFCRENSSDSFAQLCSSVNPASSWCNPALYDPAVEFAPYNDDYRRFVYDLSGAVTPTLQAIFSAAPVVSATVVLYRASIWFPRGVLGPFPICSVAPNLRWNGWPYISGPFPPLAELSYTPAVTGTGVMAIQAALRSNRYGPMGLAVLAVSVPLLQAALGSGFDPSVLAFVVQPSTRGIVYGTAAALSYLFWYCSA